MYERITEGFCISKIILQNIVHSIGIPLIFTIPQIAYELLITLPKTNSSPLNIVCLFQGG